jgi:hypothetical protein
VKEEGSRSHHFECQGIQVARLSHD